MKLQDWVSQAFGGLRSLIPDETPPTPAPEPINPFSEKGNEALDYELEPPISDIEAFQENPFKYHEQSPHPHDMEGYFNELWARKRRGEYLEPWEEQKYIELYKQRIKRGWNQPRDIFYDNWDRSIPRFPDVFPWNEQYDWNTLDHRQQKAHRAPHIALNDFESDRWEMYDQILKGRIGRVPHIDDYAPRRRTDYPMSEYPWIEPYRDMLRQFPRSPLNQEDFER